MILNDNADSGQPTTPELFARGDFAGAEILCRGATLASPQDASAHYNLGVVLTKLGRLEEALACYRRAIELNPGFAPAYSNFGFCLNAFNMVAQARQAFAIARTLDPDNPVPILNEGIAALALGDYTAGWDGFAARWQFPAYAKFKRSFKQPMWEGENLNGKKLFLYAEQGFGDTFQMARFVRPLTELGATVIVEAQPALAELLRSLPDAPIVVTKGDAIPDFDFYSAMMDLPRLLDITVDTIPASTPYLFADEARAKFYHDLSSQKQVRRIGLCWAGRVSHENDHNRSLAFSQLTPLLSIGDIEWVSLQRLVSEKDRAALQASPVLDWGTGFVDFSAAAAAIAALDLVITVDTAIAHLAGALGKPFWLLLPFYADWRWLMGREDSPWYPTARLFRQQRRGDWMEVINRIGEAL